MRHHVLFLLLAFCETAVASEVKQTRDVDGQFVGAIGCRSSSCHGGAGEKRSQYITWSQKDFHTRGYAILLDARSARIAEAAGISEAQSSARCTVCHSPFQSVAPARLASTARPDEGVSCENCHGAASSWLRGHTRADWTYATRVSAGMHDLRNLYGRANACVACHQNVAPEILKAGHPALVFELDSLSVNEPKHWRDDDPQSGPRSWLVGQAVALRESAWNSRSTTEASTVAQETSMALAWLLAKATNADPALPKIVEPQSSDLEPLQKQADILARHAVTWSSTETAMVGILHALSDSDSAITPGKEAAFYRAQRLTLALERLTTALDLTPNTEKELEGMRRDVQRHYDFDAAAFTEHLRAFRSTL